MFKRIIIFCLRPFYRLLKKILSKKARNNLRYFRLNKCFINYKNPTKFTEKIVKAKQTDKYFKYTEYSDKYLVRNYISKFDKNLLVPLYQVCDNVDEIDFTKFKKAVIKTNKASGDYIFYDENTDIDDLKKKINKSLNSNFSKVGDEMQYKNIVPKILVEKNLLDDGELYNYKFYCFKGKIKFIAISTNDGFWQCDENLNKPEFHMFSVRKYPPLEKPKNFNKIKKIVSDISNKFEFVRVDLYLVNEKIYFSELTFSPTNGIINIDPIKYDYELGKLIDYDKL